MYDPTNEVAKVLNQGMSTDAAMMFIGMGCAAIPLLFAGMTLNNLRRPADERNLRADVELTGFFTAAFLLINFFGLPVFRARMFDLPAEQIIQAAQQQRLVAEPLRDHGGNVVADNITLRDGHTETLFGNAVETSTWSREVSTEQAREIDRILTESKQGYVVWAAPGK